MAYPSQWYQMLLRVPIMPIHVSILVITLSWIVSMLLEVFQISLYFTNVSDID